MAEFTGRSVFSRDFIAIHRPNNFLQFFLCNNIGPGWSEGYLRSQLSFARTSGHVTRLDFYFLLCVSLQDSSLWRCLYFLGNKCSRHWFGVFHCRLSEVGPPRQHTFQQQESLDTLKNICPLTVDNYPRNNRRPGYKWRLILTGQNLWWAHDIRFILNGSCLILAHPPSLSEIPEIPDPPPRFIAGTLQTAGICGSFFVLRWRNFLAICPNSSFAEASVWRWISFTFGR